MRRITLLMVLAVLVMVIALHSTALATRVVGAYTPIYEGIQYATGSDDTPRLMKAFALKIDLQNPNVVLYCSHDNGTVTGEATPEPATTFLADHSCKVAVNASFSSGNDIWGVEISNGTVVSGPYAAPFDSVLEFTQAKVPNLITTATTPTGQYTAIAGAEIMLANGVCVSQNPDIQPRTFMGLSQDKRYLILICVDGRQPGWSEGCQHPEAAQWLLDFGAWDGVNMDGGRSTGMVREDIGVCNRSCWNTNDPTDLRPVPVHIGVLTTPLPGADIIIDNPAGSCSANWATGTSYSGKYGANYRSRATAAVSDPFTWTPNIQVAGNYEVYAWWPTITSSGKPCTVAPYIINYNGGTQTVNCNQTTGGGTWHSLGIFSFAAGTSGNIQLSCWTTLKKIVYADAIKLVQR